MRDITQYTDKDGYVVKIGYVLGWEENFQTPENEMKYFVLEGLPDLGNMLIVREIASFDWNEQDGYKITHLEGSAPFVVEPWKMGAI